MTPTPTNPAALLREAVVLLSDTESYLSALHGAVARHDHLGADLTCGGCTLRDRITAARRVLGTTTGQPATAPWPPTGVERPDHALYTLLRKAGLTPEAAQQEIDTYTQTILARQTPAVNRATVLNEAADHAESLRQFERCTGPRRAAQTSENVGVLRVADSLRRMAAEAQQPTPAEDESCGRFVPDTPRAPGLCASCGDAKGWHSLLATAEPATPPAAPAMPEESKPAVRMCPAKHGKWGRICDQADGHTGFHSGPIPNGGVTWEGDAP